MKKPKVKTKFILDKNYVYKRTDGTLLHKYQGIENNKMKFLVGFIYDDPGIGDRVAWDKTSSYYEFEYVVKNFKQKIYK